MIKPNNIILFVFIAGCSNFLLANIFWKIFADAHLLSQANAEEWYFISADAAWMSALILVRCIFKPFRQFFLFIDLLLNFAIAALLVEVLADATAFNFPQYISAIICFGITMRRWMISRRT